MTRRAALAAAGAAAVAGGIVTRPRPALATVTPNPFVRHFLLGASVTRLANSATDTKDRPTWHIPYAVVDAHDGRGLTVPATDGSPNLYDTFLSYIGPPSGLRPGDWVVFDWTLGTEPVATAAPVVDLIVARCQLEGYRLGWVIPRVMYQTAPLDPVQQQWNADARAMLEAKVPAVPVSALVDWPRLVETWTLISPSLPQAQKDLGAPLLYDGRHPTGTSANPGRGCERWSMAVAAAVGY